MTQTTDRSDDYIKHLQKMNDSNNLYKQNCNFDKLFNQLICHLQTIIHYSIQLSWLKWQDLHIRAYVHKHRVHRTFFHHLHHHHHRHHHHHHHHHLFAHLLASEATTYGGIEIISITITTFCFLTLRLETLTNLNENFSRYRGENAYSTDV